MAAVVIPTSPGMLRFNIASADLAQEVQLSAKNSSQVTVFFEDDPGKFALIGVDGDILVAANQTNVDADRYFTTKLGRNQTSVSIFVQADVADTDCVVIVEPA